MNTGLRHRRPPNRQHMEAARTQGFGQDELITSFGIRADPWKKFGRCSGQLEPIPDCQLILQSAHKRCKVTMPWTTNCNDSLFISGLYFAADYPATNKQRIASCSSCWYQSCALSLEQCLASKLSSQRMKMKENGLTHSGSDECIIYIYNWNPPEYFHDRMGRVDHWNIYIYI